MSPFYSGRSFPKHPYFKSASGEGQQLMNNVLHAYAVLDKEVGYCQGLSFVAGVIVMHVSVPAHGHIVLGMSAESLGYSSHVFTTSLYM